MGLNPLTIPEIVQIAKASQYLADAAISKGTLFGAVPDPQLGLKIYTIRQDVSDLYDLDPNNTNGTYDLYAFGNFLYGLCGKYALTAQAVIAGGGGSVVPPVDPNQYIWYALLTTFGDETIDINATAVFARGVLVEATSVTTLFINNQQKVLDIDFTFDSSAGEITLLGGNLFYTGDIIAMQFYRKIN